MRERQQVLIIEDDPGMTRFTASLLRLEGYDVQVEVDGGSGLSAMRGSLPDLLLLDLRLPTVSGWQVLEEMQADSSLSDIPVLVFTASAEKATIDRASELGAVGVIPKPVGSRQLVQLIAGVLREHA